MHSKSFPFLASESVCSFSEFQILHFKVFGYVVCYLVMSNEYCSDVACVRRISLLKHLPLIHNKARSL